MANDKPDTARTRVCCALSGYSHKN